MADERTIRLVGRIILNFDIEATTGLHIGGATESIDIGGVDKTVIRDPLTKRPYIPGSSLRGKVRSLIEKYTGKQQNKLINQGYIHSCEDAEQYQTCEVCRPFGVPGDRNFGTPARLVVRDLHLSDASADRLHDANTDLPFTEVKVEVAIDRVTSQANPRQLERVPAGSDFSGGELVYSFYEGVFSDEKKNAYTLDPGQDLEMFDTVLMGMQLLEDDYLGGAGARGSGKVAFKDLRLGIKNGALYPSAAESLHETPYESLAALRDAWPTLKAEIGRRLAGL
jgi:CRISPR-associated protein Csm3